MEKGSGKELQGTWHSIENRGVHVLSIWNAIKKGADFFFSRTRFATVITIGSSFGMIFVAVRNEDPLKHCFQEFFNMKSSRRTSQIGILVAGFKSFVKVK